MFNKRLFTILSFAFIVSTVIGTVSHEFGHYAVAKYLGYNASISYAYTHWETGSHLFNSQDDLYITLGGPLQTLITGTVGLLLLIIFRRSFFAQQELVYWQWTLIFLSLFWLRQPACLFIRIFAYFINGKMSGNGDEIDIASHLRLPGLSIEIVTAFIGLIILAVIIFKFIPVKQRLTFILSGITGGITGGILWFSLGKYVMP